MCHCINCLDDLTHETQKDAYNKDGNLYLLPICDLGNNT